MPSPVLDNLVSDITAANTVIDSAVVFVEGVPALIRAAVEAAQANGATAEELAPLNALSDELEAKAGALKTAMETPGPSPSRRR